MLSVNPLQSGVTFLYPLKTSENLKGKEKLKNPIFEIVVIPQTFNVSN